MHSTPVVPASNVVPYTPGGLKQTWPASASPQFSSLDEKMMLLQICYPNLNVVPLIPESVQIQSTLSEEQKKEVKDILTELIKIFKDSAPIRDTFSGMAFMLQNPHLMTMFLNASSSHKNNLPLANKEASVLMRALQLLRLFEAFVKSFSVPVLLQSMGEVSPEVASQGMSQLEELYKILGQNQAFSFFLEGLIFALKLQQSNPPAQAPKPNRSLGGALLSAKGGIVKGLGRIADVAFENVKDANDMIQSYSKQLKNVPFIGGVVEPAQNVFNSILDGMHMVIGETAESVGNALQSQGRQPLQRQENVSFTNTKNFELDEIMNL